VHIVVLDTNVLISAIAFEGKPREVFSKVLKGQIQLAISEDILGEMEGVLSGKKFKYPKGVVRSIRNALEDLAEFVIPQKEVKRIKKDPDDNRILECAVEAEAHFIISGDKHLLELKQYKNTRIITPSDYLKEF
jgi:putative PIN family toxin of toxin-antitoxin system